ncbi:MAG: hypothetical protein K1X66_04800 [Verrucomicrobiae bacterium]|nr:hypothetical protein [Verrucomicrobiae bacterium]
MKKVFPFLILLLTSSLSQAQSKIWSCVVYGKMGEGNVESALTPYTNEMQRIFGYRHYEIIGSQWTDRALDQPNWLKPTKEFILKLSPVSTASNNSQFYLKLYQDQKREVLLKSRLRMSPATPLYIAGPAYGKGKIIFILEMKDTDSKTASQTRP